MELQRILILKILNIVSMWNENKFAKTRKSPYVIFWQNTFFTFHKGITDKEKKKIRKKKRISFFAK